MTEPVLRLTAVSKSFRQRGFFGTGTALTAVHDVSLSVAPAEIVALVGESGAGKSTLTRLVLGLTQPDSGRIEFNGRDVTQISAGERRILRRKMHLVFQDPYQSLHPGMRVAQLVAEPLTIAGRETAVAKQQRVMEALTAVGLQPAAHFLSRFPHELSGGQRQRVALARALIGRPRLILADEPTSMLDVSLQNVILRLIDKIRWQYESAVLFITHDLRVAASIADRIAVMKAGQVVEIGEKSAVVGSAKHPYTRRLIAASL